MALGGIYETGTVTIAVGGVSVTGVGTLWSPIVEIGDWLLIGGQVGLVGAVVDDTHLTLESAWQGTLPAAAVYTIIKMSWLRYDPALTQSKLRELLEELEAQGNFLFVEGDEPDPGMGDVGQWALKANETPWTLWYKEPPEPGTWVEQAPPGGAAAPARTALTASTTFYVRSTPVTFTVTIATPAVVTRAAHGMVANQGFVPSTTGALPTGLSPGLSYYVKTVLDANTFTLSATPGGTVINTTGSQSGTHSFSTGSDTNNGSAPTAAGAFLTRQAARNHVAANYQLVGNVVVTFQCADGKYDDVLACYGLLVGQQGSWQELWQGNPSTPANCHCALTQTGYAFFIGNHGAIGAAVTITGWKITNTVGGGIAAVGARITLGAGLEFGAVASFHIVSSELGNIGASGISYTVSGGGISHIYSTANSLVGIGSCTITFLNSPTFGMFVLCQASQAQLSSVTFVNSGTVAGQKFQTEGGQITTSGDRNYLPGNAAGTVTANGVYRGTEIRSRFEGTTINDAAAAGFIGETADALAALGSVSLTSGTAANITSVSLTAGDWEVVGTVYYLAAASTTIGYLWTSTNTNSAAPNSNMGQRADVTLGGAVIGPLNYYSVATPSHRVSLAATTTLYLVAQASFGVSTLVAGGVIHARRVR